MQQALLTVRYNAAANPDTFLEQMGPAAEAIASTPGLAWKIWGFDRQTGNGLSAYLFESMVTAETFAQGPVPELLRQHPLVSGVEVACAPIDVGLSVTTRAGHVLAAQFATVA